MLCKFDDIRVNAYYNTTMLPTYYMGWEVFDVEGGGILNQKSGI